MGLTEAAEDLQGKERNPGIELEQTLKAKTIVIQGNKATNRKIKQQ